MSDQMTLPILILVGLICANGFETRVAVNTSFGALNGYHNLFGSCSQWLGVPFAEAPVGPLRFEDPVKWSTSYPSGGRDATKYGNVCPQATTGNEDCLFLNVWRPKAMRAGELLPVMVWIHGGAFVEGASSSAAPPLKTNLYDGCNLASKHDVIIVSMNYRLGPLGFLSFEDSTGRGANYGMKDQREALHWLQNELQAFGGDSAKVTIFGESAGGISVFHHLASPLSKGLFRAAISESGFPNAALWPFAKEQTKNFAKTVNCTEESSLRECLRKVDTSTLIKNAGEAGNPFTGMQWGASVDGVDLPDHPYNLFMHGRVNSVPLLAGTNTDEGNMFIWPFYELGMNKAQFEKLAHEVWDGHDPSVGLNSTEMGKLFGLYEPAPTKDYRSTASAMMTDGTFLCGTREAVNTYASSQDVFLYRFNHRSACDWSFDSVLPGVFHSSELSYVFDNAASEACFLTLQERALGKRMQTMWTNFAKYLSPTPSVAKSEDMAFPKYSNTSKTSLVFQVPSDVLEHDYRGGYCSFWRDVVYPKLKVGQVGALHTPWSMIQKLLQELSSSGNLPLRDVVV